MLISPEEIKSLDQFFANTPLPEQLKLDQATTLTNVARYVKETLENLKRTDVAEAAMRPRLDRLLLIKQLLEKQASQA